MATLTVQRPTFIATDPNAIVAQMVADFEALTGRTLRPAQYERLLISQAAYRESLVRVGVQITGEQNLVAWAEGSHLDDLGLLVGCLRFQARAATAIERFTLPAPAAAPVPIPTGSRVQCDDPLLVFSTGAASTVPIGASHVDLTVTAQTTGGAANNLAPGTISTMVDLLPGIVSASNTSTSSGGLVIEDDEAYRRRLILAPYQFGTAGSLGGYKYWALSLGQEYVDADVTSPAGGQIQVALLMNTGAPTAAQMLAVAAQVSADLVRPVSDTVTVVAANRLTYSIAATLVVYSDVDQASVLAAARAAAQSYVDNRKKRLGLDVTPAQVLSAILSVPGIYDLTLTQPAVAVAAGSGDWCDCTGINITISGSSNG